MTHLDFLREKFVEFFTIVKENHNFEILGFMLSIVSVFLNWNLENEFFVISGIKTPVGNKIYLSYLVFL